MEMLLQATSLVGAAFILFAYASLQAGRMGRGDASFHWLNLLGSLLLTVVAIYDIRWGFIALESIWAAISLVGLLRLRKRAA